MLNLRMPVASAKFVHWSVHYSPADTNFDYSCRHGISRTDFNLLSDPELSFLEVISKMPSNPGSTLVNKGIESGKVLFISLYCCCHKTSIKH